MDRDVKAELTLHATEIARQCELIQLELSAREHQGTRRSLVEVKSHAIDQLRILGEQPLT